MASPSPAPTSGILYVTMQPDATLSPAQFHDWYNNEHGPVRLRLPYIPNGFRYRATDLDSDPQLPEWMAIYDIADMTRLTEKEYAQLRAPGVKSSRETDTMSQIAVDRRMFDLLDGKEGIVTPRLETLAATNVEEAAKTNVLMNVTFQLFPGEETERELGKWYAEEHYELISRIPGWRRSRRFVTSSIDEGPRQFVALHEFASKNILGTDEYKAAISTPWAKEILTKVVKDRKRRIYELNYIFGPAPRHLAGDLAEWAYTDGFTRTYPSPQHPNHSVIESYIRTTDHIPLSYRLEGSSSAAAPLIILCNPILVNYTIWDPFVTSFLSRPENQKYRILRYNVRGRTEKGALDSKPITMDVLTADLITILDALRIPAAAALIGVSIGGITVMNAALEYPTRVTSFLACDTNAVAPATNKQAWGERIALAENDADPTVSKLDSDPPDRTVGPALAEVTVKRWFTPANHSHALVQRTKEMVSSGSLNGFKNTVNALYEYDFRAAMSEALPYDEGSLESVKAGFVVGAADGILPEGMKIMAESWAGRKEGPATAVFEVIDDAGHLPMLERPEEFRAVVERFLI